MSAPLDKIVILPPGRLNQEKLGVGNNQFTRASDVNPIIDYLNTRSSINGSSVTQLTSTATGVTLNGNIGTVVMFTSTAATTVGATFVLTNANISAASIVLAQVNGYTGTLSTNGFPVVTSVIPAAGTAQVTVVNAGTNALSGVVTICFLVL